MKTLKAFIVLIFIVNIAYGQVDQGKVFYDVTYPGSDFDSAVTATLPFESVTWFKQHMVRIDLQSGKGIPSIVIVDNRKQEVHVLMDMMGDKSDILMTKSDVEQELQNQQLPSFSKTDEVKSIAGYRCIKADASMPDGRRFTVWYTNDIKVENVNWNNQFRSVDGFLMEFSMKQGTLNMTMTARSVNTEAVPDSIFEVPAGYRTITQAELKRISKGK